MSRFLSIAGVWCVGVFVALVVITDAGHAPAAAFAQSGETGGSNVAYDEAEAQAIDRMLMCPVCPAESIDQAQVPQARQMRAQVRVLLANGSSREDVLDWFRARYGPGIVAEPPRSGFNLIAWIVPGVAVVAGIIGGVLALRAMRRRSSGSYDGDVSGSDADLQPYLATVDRELALGRQNPEGPSDG